MKVSRRVSVSPGSFIIPMPERSTSRQAIQTGASAEVLHGIHEGTEVAIKMYRLHERVLERRRQVSLLHYSKRPCQSNNDTIYRSVF